MSNTTKMSSFEIRTSLFLASVYGLRMLGMFLILPIFAIYASQLSGSPSQLQIGLALGVYGLTQAIFQIPFGISSDIIGRKKVIYFGLTIFILGIKQKSYHARRGFCFKQKRSRLSNIITI